MKRSLYAAYFTGAAGVSVGCFYIGDGIIAGIDVGGIKYDGVIDAQSDGSHEAIVEFEVPEGVALVTGMVGGKDASMSLKLTLAKDFADGSTVTRIDTPAGPINAKFELVRELP